jgi:hypothetical protein
MSSPLGLTPYLSPEAMYTHISKMCKSKKYPTITTPAPQYASWHSLSMHKNMETRACFHTGSRIHVSPPLLLSLKHFLTSKFQILTCGHTIFTNSNAQPCAANCSSPMITGLCFTQPVPAAHAPALAKNRTAIQEALDSFCETSESQTLTHIEILKTLLIAQDSRLRPQVDLIGGDFACLLCSLSGQRPTVPAFALPCAPFFRLVVGLSENDVAVIKKLELGTVPVAPLPSLVSSVKAAESSKPGDKGMKGMPPEALGRVKNSRVTKQRVAEKKRVIGILRDEACVDELESLEL